VEPTLVLYSGGIDGRKLASIKQVTVFSGGAKAAQYLASGHALKRPCARRVLVDNIPAPAPLTLGD